MRDVRTIWCKKYLDFSKFMVCLHGQGRRVLNQCGHFADKGRSIFAHKAKSNARVPRCVAQASAKL